MVIRVQAVAEKLARASVKAHVNKHVRVVDVKEDAQALALTDAVVDAQAPVQAPVQMVEFLCNLSTLRSDLLYLTNHSRPYHLRSVSSSRLLPR